MFNKQLLRKAYLFNLSAIAVMLPLSVWLLTFFIITLIVIWAADGGPLRIAGIRKNNPALLIFTGSYFVFLLWMFNTSDIRYGLRELEQKLPLLLMPLVIALSEPPDTKELRTILSLFVGGVIISSATGLVFFYVNSQNDANIRGISMFIPYMQLAEMANMAIVISLYYYFRNQSGRTRYLYLVSAIWLTGFLFLLISITGLLLLTCLTAIGLFLLIKGTHNKVLKAGSLTATVVIIVLAGGYIHHEIKGFYISNGNEYTYLLKENTINGNPYQHYPERKDIENGNPVWIYLCEQELSKEWNRRSLIKYDSTDLRNQQIKYTIIRYITSKGFTKDSSGVTQLTNDDIKYIENGLTNVLFTGGKQIKSKIYEVIWQIDYYRNGGNPSGHSVTQRLEFLKTGWSCFRRSMIFGTGTGDFRDEMVNQYIKDKSKLDVKYWYLPHNQYLTFLIAFGITGLAIILFSVIYPVIITRAGKNILFNLFLLIILLSMAGEDTLETHTGVTFFAYFYSLFVFGRNEKTF